MSSIDSAQRAEIQAQIDRLLASTCFSSSLRRGQLLRYLVQHALADIEEINEYAIGVDVFEKPPSFDPRIESIVRTEVGRLRQKLKEYYAREDCLDRVLIEIPLRCYRPAFLFREPVTAPLTDAAPTESASLPRPAPRRWFGAALLFSLTVVLAAAALVLWKARNPPAGPIRSLVVLPFENLSPDKNDEYLSDGLTDELTGEFANWKDLRVVARTSAYQYQGKGVDIRQIGRELDVDAVLEGSLARQGSLVRITAQLNRTSDGYHLWSHSYDTRSHDMLSVRQEIARAIAAAVRNLGGKVQIAAPRDTTHNPDALDLYLQANYQYSRLAPESLEKSLGLFHAAIDKDPAYVGAYVGLARAEMELTNFYPSQGAVERARMALEKALELDPDSGDARGLRAEFTAYYEYDWPRAEREFQLALEKGAQPSIRAIYGWSLAMHGRATEAQQQCTAAESVAPLGIAPRFCQIYTDYYQRRYAEAQKMLLETLEVSPNLVYAHSRLGFVYLLENNRAEAASQFDWSAARVPARAAALARAYASACRGETARARKYLSEAAGFIAPLGLEDLALGYILLHDKDGAIAYLRTVPTGRLGFILHDPLFDELRSDARYVALERAAGIAP